MMTEKPRMDQIPSRKRLDLTELRERLGNASGRTYWRSLDELAATEEFEELVRREFPEQAAELADPVSRRHFLKLAGATLAFGGLTNCTIQPEEKILPYVRQPEDFIPGKPLYYASTIPFGGAATGILVESHMGRPTKIEGNPQHPGSLGASDAITQASILDLYDPDRAKTVTNAGLISTWSGFVGALNEHLEEQRLKGGSGLRILTQTVLSPTLGDQLETLLAVFPKARWHQHEAAARQGAYHGSMIAFGEGVNSCYDLSEARVILSLDADFAYAEPGHVLYARQFADRRRLAGDGDEMNRLYVIESTPTCTGSVADHRLALGPGELELFARQLALELGVALAPDSASSAQAAAKHPWVSALARDLQSQGPASVVIPGEQQSPAVHALAHAMNQKLGGAGSGVYYTDAVEANPIDQVASMRQLVDDMTAGEVDLLVIAGGNPVYDAPVDFDLERALEHVPFRVNLSPYTNETSNLCHWHIPESHFLESWSDARAYDGTASIVQPLIKPLYNSKSAHELVGVLSGQSGRNAYDLVREYWNLQYFGDDFETDWRTWVHDGVIPDTAHYPLEPMLNEPLTLPRPAPLTDDGEIHIAFRPDPLIWDGRLANNGWLQETPQPITKLTWDNAALLSPATAKRLGLHNEQVVELGVGEHSVRAPVWIVPGQAENLVTCHLGYGRWQAGHIGGGAGFSAYALRPSTNPWHASELRLTKTYDRHALASTQDHHSMEGRHLVRYGDLDDYQKRPHFVHDGVHEPDDDFTLYPRRQYTGNQWGMAIDLSACIGCNACSLACQAENNIPIVGKDEVLVGREMSWIRIDRYFTDLDDPQILHQPIPCQQCETAPCEVVCPVTATSHSEEGLNDMIYNRCVGTRYCSNNCPYKVRRFNWLQYVDRDSPSLKLQRNPDVTVRARGVMEKCTYCTQRINAQRIESKKRGQPIADGSILTACQQSCPTQAIAFGNINDPDSQVTRWKSSPLNYGILTELNTRPRTTYVARVSNPNPDMPQA